MRENERTRHDRQRTGFKDQKRVDGRDQSQPQYTHPSRNPKAFDVDQHIRAARRASIDAYCLFKDWPSQIRFSYFVGSNGRLMVRAERKGGI